MAKTKTAHKFYLLVFDVLIWSAVIFTCAYAWINIKTAEARGGANSGPILTVTPNPVPLNTSFTISGSGFTRGSIYYVGLSGYFGLEPVTVSSTGTFSITQKPIVIAGNYTAIAVRDTSVKGKSRPTAYTAPFTVE